MELRARRATHEIAMARSMEEATRRRAARASHGSTVRGGEQAGDTMLTSSEQRRVELLEEGKIEILAL
jgi:hypothetical protein